MCFLFWFDVVFFSGKATMRPIWWARCSIHLPLPLYVKRKTISKAMHYHETGCQRWNDVIFIEFDEYYILPITTHILIVAITLISSLSLSLLPFIYFFIMAIRAYNLYLVWKCGLSIVCIWIPVRWNWDAAKKREGIIIIYNNNNNL